MADSESAIHGQADIAPCDEVYGFERTTLDSFQTGMLQVRRNRPRACTTAEAWIYTNQQLTGGQQSTPWYTKRSLSR